MLTIDASKGEGGGHIVRTALALSLVTGKPFALEKIRALRTTPGLQRPHLAALQAAAAVSKARVEGAALESQRILFAPATVAPGKYRFAVGAGSTALLAETLLPALLLAGGPSELVIDGATVGPLAPTWDFFAESYLAVLRKLGAKVKPELWRHGFAPEGGGALRVTVTPAPLKPVDLIERGRVLARRAVARIAKMSRGLAEREIGVLEGRLGWGKPAYAIEDVEASGAGNVVVVTMRHEHVTHVDTEIHDPERMAEITARALANRLDLHLATAAPVGPHLADQILVPLAAAGGGSFRTVEPTRHTHATIDVIAQFLPDLRVEARDHGDRTWTVSLRRG